MKDFTAAKRHIDVSVGESVRILREFQGLSQNGRTSASQSESLSWQPHYQLDFREPVTTDFNELDQPKLTN